MKILVIDDDTHVRVTLKKHLQRECFAVDTAGNGDEGSYMARTNAYDLIIIDNVMPKKSGLQVCADIRGAGNFTPILILSVHMSPEDKIAFLNSGADDYVTKPFNFEEVLARIRALLRRPRVSTESNIHVGSITLDNKTHEILKNGKSVYLTRKEYALTEFMMKRAGSILSRGVLMEHVWHSDANPFSNTLESHILNIRKKLGDTDNTLIETIPGRGYRIQSIGTHIGQ